jgi:uncharacterized membrane protein YkvA (DUF1232 family)
VKPRLIEKWQQRARRLRVETYALYLAYRDPRVPWYARVLAACVVAYAFSPLDLVPDFVPVLGYLDDLILVPAGIALAIRLIPPAVLDESRETARQRLNEEGPTNWTAAAVIVAIWLVLAAVSVAILVRVFRG